MAEKPGFNPHEAKELPPNQPEGIVEVKRSPEGFPQVEVDFLYTYHQFPEDALIVAEKVKDADLVLVEFVGHKPEERRSEEEFLNQIASKGFGTKPREQLVIRSLLDRKDFAARFIGALAGSGKEIKLIDVPSTHPAAEIVEAAKVIESEVASSMAKGKVEEAFQHYLRLLGKLEQTDPLREEFVLDELSNFLPKLNGVKRVAVVQGAKHTKVHHDFVKRFPGINTRIKFSESVLRYDIATWLSRQKRFFPERKIEEGDYRRGFVEDLIFFRGARPLLGGKQARDFALNLGRVLSVEEADEVLDQFSERQKDDLASGLDGRQACSKNVALITYEWAQKKGVSLTKFT